MKNAFKIIKLVFNKYPFYVIFGFITSIFNAIVPLLNVYSIKIIIEILEGNNPNFNDVVYVALIFIGIYAILSVLNSYYYKRFSPIMEQKIHSTLKLNFFNEISKTELISFEDSKFYDNVSKAANVIEKNVIRTCDYFFSFLNSLFQLIVLSGAVIIFNYKLILISFIFIFVNLVLSVLTGKYGYLQYESNVKSIRKHNYITSLFTSKKFSEELKIYDTSPYLLDEYNDITNKKVRNIKKFSKKTTFFFSIQKVLQLSFSIILIIVLSRDVINGSSSLGVFSAMLVASQSFVSSFSSLFNVIPNLKKESLYINNYFEFMKIEKEIKGSLNCNFKDLRIIANGISFNYPNDDKTVISEVNMTIEGNNKIGIIGHNGAGKTTLIKLLIGEYFPQKGAVFFNDNNIKEIDRKKLYERISIIPQNFNVYEFSIAENILMRKYNKEKDRDSVISVLQKVGLWQKVDNLQDKEETVLGKAFEEKGTDFSGGEKQKIAICRALIRDSEIIIMDEPTSSLDPVAEKELIDLSMKLFKDKKMIIITHRLSMVLKTDYLYYMENGKIVEKGSHNELIQMKGRYYDLFMTQASHYIAGNEH